MAKQQTPRQKERKKTSRTSRCSGKLAVASWAEDHLAGSVVGLPRLGVFFFRLGVGWKWTVRFWSLQPYVARAKSGDLIPFLFRGESDPGPLPPRALSGANRILKAPSHRALSAVGVVACLGSLTSALLRPSASRSAPHRLVAGLL